MKKAFLILALLFSLILVGCTTPGTPGSESNPDGNRDAILSPGTDTPQSAGITTEQFATYVLIRPEFASDTVTHAASQLYTHIKNQYGLKLTFRDDFYKAGVEEIGAYEILLGETNRPESTAFIATLRRDDYGYTLAGDKIVIAGKTDEGTARAMDLFTKNILSSDRKNAQIFFAETDNCTVTKTYAIDTLTIAGRSAVEYTVVYPKKGQLDEKNCAENLAEMIADLTGFVLPVLDDSKASPDTPVILVGQTALSGEAPDLADNEYVITTGDALLAFHGSDTTALLTAVNRFGETLNESGKNVTFTLSEPQRGEVNTTLMTAMSFNIYCQQVGERKDMVLEVIQSYMPDTFGIQEATQEWVNILSKNLRDTYAWVTEGRDGGSRGEHNSIFYNKDKFKLIDSGTRWLSDTPDKVSRVETSTYNRIFTYALLERKSDGVQIMVINTHFEHTGEEARIAQAKVLAQFIEENSQYPIVLTGDFNDTAGAKSHQTILGTGLVSSSTIAAEKETVLTFNGFGDSSSVIDFIFVSPDTITVNKYEVFEEKIDGQYPSDHNAIVAEYIIAK